MYSSAVSVSGQAALLPMHTPNSYSHSIADLLQKRERSVRKGDCCQAMSGRQPSGGADRQPCTESALTVVPWDNTLGGVYTGKCLRLTERSR